MMLHNRDIFSKRLFIELICCYVLLFLVWMLGRGMGIPGSSRRSRDTSAITRYEVPQGKVDLGRCLRREIAIVQDLERWSTATDNDDEQFRTMFNTSQQIA